VGHLAVLPPDRTPVTEGRPASHSSSKTSGNCSLPFHSKSLLTLRELLHGRQTHAARWKAFIWWFSSVLIIGASIPRNWRTLNPLV
jgi:hypothetical protein